MKKKILLSLFTSLAMYSCNLSDEMLETPQKGIMFRVRNRTSVSYNNTQVIIGGIDKEDEFITVDSYSLPKIEPGISAFLNGWDDRRWKPDFERIKKIGDGTAYFKFQFEGKEAMFIEYVNNPTQKLSIAPNRFKEISNNEGILDIRIDENSEFDINGDNVYGFNSLTRINTTE